VTKKLKLRRIHAGRYAIGKFEIWLERRSPSVIWRVWEDPDIKSKAIQIDGFPTLREAVQAIREERI
jgi:hypothetical protein